MLDRFTVDPWKIAQDGGLTKARTAFAMPADYDIRLAANETLFETNTTAITAGIRFDRRSMWRIPLLMQAPKATNISPIA